MKIKDYIIALDIGTTSTKGMLIDLQGNIHDLHSISHQAYYSEENKVEQDPEDVFHAVIDVVHFLIYKNRINPRLITALSFGGILNSMVPVDQNCTPLTRALIWADSRSIEESNYLRQNLDNEHVKNRTGCTIHPMYFLPRLLWFKEKESNIFRKAHKFISIKEYVLYKLYGDFIVDRSVASGTGIWNMSTMDWDIDLLQYIGMSYDKLSRIVETTYIMDGLKAKYADEMGLLSGTPGVVGASDGALAHLGSVGLSDNEMSITIGTGAALRRRVGSPMVLKEGDAWCYYMIENNWLLGGIIQDAGIVMKWFSETFIPKIDETEKFSLINEYAEEIKPGSEGLLFFPSLGGERCPHDNPHLRGAVLGLSFNHNIKHLARALMEGISYRLYSVFKMLTYDRDMELVVSGGILKSPAWLQLVSDFFGKTLWKVKVREASTWGAFIIGLRALGIINRLDEVNNYVSKGDKIEPNIKNYNIYQNLYKSYNSVYEDVVNASLKINK
jgi:gluconokinase